MRRRDVKRSWWIVVSLALLASSGCAAKQSGTAKPSGFLRDYAQLATGKEGEAQLVYVNPQADFGKYTKILIEPVTIWDDAQTATIPRDEAQLLADDLDDALRFTLRRNFALVDHAGPATVRDHGGASVVARRGPDRVALRRRAAREDAVRAVVRDARLRRPGRRRG